MYISAQYGLALTIIQYQQFRNLLVSTGSSSNVHSQRSYVDKIMYPNDSTKQQVMNAHQSGFSTVFQVSAGFSAFSFFASIVLLKEKSLCRSEDDALKESKAWLAEHKLRRKRGKVEVDVEKA